MKKRLFLWLLLLLLLPFPARAEPLLPDLAEYFGRDGQHYLTDYEYRTDFICDVWLYDRSRETDADIRGGWLAACVDAGFTVFRDTVDEYDAYVAQSGELLALLLPDYGGRVMLMVQKGLRYAPQEPTPSPVPTSEPTPNGGTSVGGHLELVEVEMDCPMCGHGECSLCNGSGIYRLYGEAVICNLFCSYCNGKGTYTTMVSQFVVD